MASQIMCVQQRPQHFKSISLPANIVGLNMNSDIMILKLNMLQSNTYQFN